MKIIDEEGMILGRVNIIDIAVIIFLLILLFTAYKYLYLKNYPQDVLDKVIHPEYRWINMTVMYPNLSKIIYDGIKVGDIAHRTTYIESNVTIGKVVEKGNYKLIAGPQDLVETTILYEIYVEKKPDGLYYEGNLSTLAGKFGFKTDTYSLTGTIVDMDMGK